VSELLDARAPDGQPTENIRLMLTNEQARLDEWERSLVAALRSVESYTDIIKRNRETVNRLKMELRTRLREEQEAVEVNGL
jgi:spore cortex formation protein SpoVR/YcgB (stage V sporulation)